jgi:uncharacterized membrane protein required for colicin V production
MSLDSLPFNWFDLTLVVVLAMGIHRGRQRGMSEELMTVLQWVAIIITCSIAYQPIGDWLASVSLFSHLTSYIVAYLSIAVLVSIGFVLFKRLFRGKLIGSDAFGRAEYYLGMPAGMVRFGCILLAALALLNARFYSQKEIQAELAYQNDVYGKDYFPGLQVLQANVFKQSLTGPVIRKYLGFLLIKQTAPENKEIHRKVWAMP